MRADASESHQATGGALVGRSRYVETAAGQGSVLFVAAGALGLLNSVLPDAGATNGLRAVNVGAVLFGLAISKLPWQRWDREATLALVPAALGLIVIGMCLDPHGAGLLYALWFVVVFCWIGSWHPVRTSLAMAPGAALAYIIPFVPHAPGASAEAVATVIIAIPIAVVLAAVVAAKSSAMHDALCALEDASRLLERASVTDDLTGLGNRRRANTMLDTLVAGDAVVLLDLDHFKRVNDTRGHAEGDRVLMDLGAYLLESVRDADCVARFGGEEFIIVLPGALSEVEHIIQRLLDGWRTRSGGVTLSAGLAVHDGSCSADVTLRRADLMLYQAKTRGRDRLAVDDGTDNISLPDYSSESDSDIRR
ncbi:MAG: GGDEF domain-containing protein [Acidimicrobiales bacterium]